MINLTVRPIIAACAVVINEEGRVLSVGRKNNHHDIGLPGGAADVGELLPHYTMARELREETGVVAEEAEFLYAGMSDHSKPGRLIVCYTYLVTEWHGTPESLEGPPVAFVKWDTLTSGKSSSFASYNAAVWASWWALQEHAGGGT